MEWIETNIYTTSEGIEVVTALLLENGINNFQIEDDKDMKLFLQNNNYWDYLDDSLLNKKIEEPHIKLYINKNEKSREILEYLKLQLEKLKEKNIGIDLGKLKLCYKNVDDKNWLNNWKKYYKPFNVGKNIVIKPVWENYENKENKIVFNINPGYLFGTGLHQTTQLCIEQIEKYTNNESKILDIGCGTGILFIISILLGAKSAIGVDIESNVTNIACENASLNNIKKDKYKVFRGNILINENIKNIVSKNKYDIIVSNIVADVINNLINFVYKISTEKTIFISSGIIEERLDDVCNNLKNNNFKIINIIEKDGWFCIVSKIIKRGD